MLRNYVRILVLMMVAVTGSFGFFTSTRPTRAGTVCNTPSGSLQLLVLGNDGKSPNNSTYLDDISPDGRYVILESKATNLSPNLTTGLLNIYLLDKSLCQITPVSVSSDGTLATGESYAAVFEKRTDFNKITFYWHATTAVTHGPGFLDISGYYEHDMHTGKTTLLKTTPEKYGFPTGWTGLITPNEDGEGWSGILNSAQGQHYTVFSASSRSQLPLPELRNISDIYLVDNQTRQTVRISSAPDGSPANKDSSEPSLSPDERTVIFHSNADNLVSGDTNKGGDIFFYDIPTHKITRLTTPDGSQPNAFTIWPELSADWRYMVFQTAATNFGPGVTNGFYNNYVRDMASGKVVRISLTPTGQQFDYHTDAAALSPDGRLIVVSSGAHNIVPGTSGIMLYMMNNPLYTSLSTPINQPSATFTPTFVPSKR